MRMRIGILTPSVSSLGQKGFYNSQEVGLARALDRYCEKVKVWRLVPDDQKGALEKLEGCRSATVEYMPAKRIGSNGLADCSLLDRELDVLICFADTQLTVPAVYRWAMKNKIRFIPYIGVLESHSDSRLRQRIMGILARRNLRIYRNCTCLAKTPEIGERLGEKGVRQTVLVPVGLDVPLLKRDYGKYDVSALKRKYGYEETDKVILFVGRMIQEKQPVQMVELFAGLAAADDRYRLLMVGSGELKEAVLRKIRECGLESKVSMLERVPNSDMWELYRLAEVSVNMNRQEIFGMAILEAMYYDCPVVAWRAPGPSLIIEDGVTGWLVDNQEEAFMRIREVIQENGAGRSFAMAEKARERVEKEFTWNCAAEKIMKEITGKL